MLAAAGRRALAEGAPDVALRLLQRAAPADAGILLLRGTAEFRTGADPLGTLDAAAAIGGPEVVAEAARLAAAALVLRSEPEAAVARLRAALAEVPAELAGELEDQLVEALAYRIDDAPEYLRVVEGAATEPVRPTLLCHLAHARAMAGAPGDEVVPLVRRASSDLGAFSRLGVERFAALWAIEALFAVEAAAEAAEALRAMSDVATRSGSRSAAGAAAWMEARWERRFGHLRRAEDLARHSLELTEGELIPALAAGTTLVGVLLDRGDAEAARATAATLPDLGPTGSIFGTGAMTARLLLTEGRADEALAALDGHDAADGARRWLIGLREDSHVLRVRVLSALGREDEARAVVDRELAATRARGVAGAEAIALLARAALAPPTPATSPVADLEAAVAAARHSPLPYVHATALAEHGAALRRAGHRAEARTPLREARDLAHRCGATALEARAHEELVVAGARPQRLAFSGVDALTASERRVAELAVRGLRNREIAEALFVSLKTVEVHLGRAYTKLGIKGRSQLPDALAT